MIANGALSRVDTNVVKRYASVFAELAASCDYTASLDGAIFSAPLTPELRKRLKKLQAVVASTAEAHGIAPEVLARKRICSLLSTWLMLIRRSSLAPRAIVVEKRSSASYLRRRISGSLKGHENT